jgi:hypothetical protein
VSQLVAVLDAIVDIIEDALTDVHDALGIQVYPRRVINPTPPAIDMYPGDPTTYIGSSGFGDRGGDVFVLRARVNAADQLSGQDLLISLMDEEDLDLAGALEDDQTVNGLATSIMVEGPFGHTLYQDTQSNVPLVGIEWRMTILRTKGVS